LAYVRMAILGHLGNDFPEFHFIVVSYVAIVLIFVLLINNILENRIHLLALILLISNRSTLL